MTPHPEALLSPDETQRLGPANVDAALGAYRELEERLEVLPDKPEETPAAALRALWLLAGGRRTSLHGALTTPLTTLGPDELERLSALVRQRLEGVPLAHLTARERFMGLEMVAGPGALIPRKETEILGHAAVALAKRLARERGEVRVIDVCTGCGNLAAAIAVAEPRAVIFASDLSEDAVSLARCNLEHLGLHGRVTLRSGDLFAPFDDPDHEESIDLITCNPPYISTRRVCEMPGEIADHEPRQAFDGGALGVSMLQRLVREAPRMLRPGGWLAFEVGVGQGPSVARRMQTAGDYLVVRTHSDEDGRTRAVVAQKLVRDEA